MLSFKKKLDFLHNKYWIEHKKKIIIPKYIFNSTIFLQIEQNTNCCKFAFWWQVILCDRKLSTIYYFIRKIFLYDKYKLRTRFISTYCLSKVTIPLMCSVQWDKTANIIELHFMCVFFMSKTSNESKLHLRHSRSK